MVENIKLITRVKTSDVQEYAKKKMNRDFH